LKGFPDINYLKGDSRLTQKAREETPLGQKQGKNIVDLAQQLMPILSLLIVGTFRPNIPTKYNYKRDDYTQNIRAIDLPMIKIK
jgi:hypothetical protein